MSRRPPRIPDIVDASVYVNGKGAVRARLLLDLVDVGRMLAGDARALERFHQTLERELGPAARAELRAVRERATAEHVDQGRPCDHTAGEYRGRCRGCGEDLLAVGEREMAAAAAGEAE